MPMRPEFRDFLLELFEPLGPVRIKNMFGGYGIYAGNVFFSLVFDEVIYFKADDETRPAFEAEGKPAFVLTNSTGEKITTSYHQIPERLYDEPDEFVAWARRSVDAAIRFKANKKRPPRAPKTAAKTRQRERRAAPVAEPRYWSPRFGALAIRVVAAPHQPATLTRGHGATPCPAHAAPVNNSFSGQV